MRYLSRSFLLGAPHRRKEIEQFLGPHGEGIEVVRWVSSWPWQDGCNENRCPVVGDR
ncbi:hypothetical protein [Micromonospora sp. NPDC048169]|uniref:hypothetical protein n=1 Tax=unclassified Micromonospora TaxID=2617518 RepID=UPI0033EB9996